MTRFFRKVRDQLLSQKKFSRYLIYAIGEIVLVVIGILIALAINNANQNRILSEKEQIYLKGLKEEFETSKMKLSELIKVNEANYNGAKQIILYMSQGNKKPSEKEFSELLYGTFSSDISYNPNISLLNEMMSSGSLKDISNFVLRNRLTNWIATLEDISRQERELDVQREKVIGMLRTNDNSIRTIVDLTGMNTQLDLPPAENSISNLELLNSTEFENNVLTFILTSYATKEAHYDPLMQDLNVILDLIEGEIKD